MIAGHAVWNEVRASRVQAHAKHGVNSIEAVPASSPRWLPILVEEVGEVASALTYEGEQNLRAELIDVLAVASAWVESIDRARPQIADPIGEPASEPTA